MPHSTSSRRHARLVRQLRVAHDSLAEWEGSLRALAAQPAPGSPHDAVELLSIVNEAKLGLSQLLTQMGANATAAGPAATAAFTTPPVVSLPDRGARATRSGEAPAGIYVKACRACGRALGTAFREAQAAADAAAAKILYGSLRALEKQMWVLDPRHVD